MSDAEQMKKIPEKPVLPLTVVPGLEQMQSTIVRLLGDIDPERTGRDAMIQDVYISMWPDAFNREPLIQIRMMIEQDMQQNKPQAMLLLNALWRHNICCKFPSAKSIQKEDSPWAAQHVGREFFNFFKLHNIDDEKQVELSRLCGKAIQDNTNGQFLIDVPYVGQRKDPSWMNFSPNNNPRVKQVIDWAVRNSDGHPLLFANVG